ncbi:U11/U12 small nuclear ribonucleoprotein 48 kDa protein [Phoenix dactylifera]|uniref:U11/U12 small nuclear ribonucleoprotein 48 kDa protein n=1 Tax=Phoenix dactylifera TaxID=42345 RepID=A0A8B9ASQ9_PHODC|nr:U11/U12 small nuclear ribonucleoprotein 48 kDa protein [Phoenix dactylifera]XP_038989831.1 U11/U12 small nuclear ribonucleoprotein 48 kDa protein [Phoenix dactylifera]
MDPQFSSSPFLLDVRPIPSYTQNSHPNPNPSLIPITDPSGADLPTTISLLKDLAALAETTLKSVSDFLSSSSVAPSSSSASFCRCLYDPRHRMPPESLFRHSFLCSSAPGGPLLDLAFLDTLRYPSSFKSEAQLQKENRFILPLRGADADLCFSLDGELGDLGSNFFYKDCPGVVTTPEPDASGRTFTLPGFLSIECANFASDSDEKGGFLMEGGVRILPSEFWALRCEVESWRDYPLSYSYAVLRVASSLNQVKEDVLKRWIISNSPQFGILIDAPMRDHIYLLFKLCLKAIGREALASLKLLLSKDGLLDAKPPSFECPRLLGSLTWLLSQLSVLYGETNGKFFTIGMLKESLIQAGSSLLLVRLGEKKAEEDGCWNAIGFGVSSKGCKYGESNSIFVSQVAAAVAALHERSLLEGRINALRFPQPLSKSQLIMEHSYASARGSEERGKRPNYRPILEHDMLPGHRVQNQDGGRAKTREELLAEERDYKRRRMSYRGKKVKRAPKEVLRDIIDEYMEEIKQAGGIECNVKVSPGAAVSAHECHSQSDVTANINGLQGSGCSVSDTRKEKSLHLDVSTSEKSNMSHDLQKIHQKPKYEHYGHWEDHEGSKHKREKKYGSRSPSSHRNYAQLLDRNEYHRDRGDIADRNDTSYSSRSKEHISRSTLTSKHLKKEYDYISDNKNKERTRTYESHRSESVTQDAFGDRYDPSSSYDEYGATYGDVFVGSNYLRSESSPRNHDQYHDKGRHDRSTRRHNQSHRKK